MHLNESFHLGRAQPAVDAALEKLAAGRVIARIWARDHTVCKPDPAEVANRLGWLDIAGRMRPEVGRLDALAQAVRADGCTQALLLGMGGSSLAPEVFREVFGVADGYLDLGVLDSTVPGAVIAAGEQLDATRTLFVVSTKSGGTVETMSFFKHFYNRVAGAVGREVAGTRFVAITDAGSSLDRLAQEHNFRAILRNDPDIGGRYSALSYFGLAPAALVGADLPRLLERAEAMTGACTDNGGPAARLGATLGALAKAGRDKLTLLISPPLASFGDWIEQLIAESTGKEGAGILPVVGEALGAPSVYGDDRLFVYLKLAGDCTYDSAVEALEAAGQPIVRYELADRYDLGGQMFLWELATAVAGHLLGINPFDQPDVESAKVRAREMVDAYASQGALPAQTPALVDGGIAVYGDVTAGSAAEALRAFLVQAGPGAYVALQAYLQPTPETTERLRAVQARVRDHTRLATTLGYGPRFLHSTGQLHKGDAGQGLFIQLTADDPQDLPIPDRAGAPDSSITFGVLKDAQALGDGRALLDGGRRLIRFHLGSDVAGGLARLADSLT